VRGAQPRRTSNPLGKAPEADRYSLLCLDTTRHCLAIQTLLTVGTVHAQMPQEYTHSASARRVLEPTRRPRFNNTPSQLVKRGGPLLPDHSRSKSQPETARRLFQARSLMSLACDCSHTNHTLLIIARALVPDACLFCCPRLIARPAAAFSWPIPTCPKIVTKQHLSEPRPASDPAFGDRCQNTSPSRPTHQPTSHRLPGASRGTSRAVLRAMPSLWLSRCCAAQCSCSLLLSQ